MKLTAIDREFGVGESTGQGKSILIRKMLKIRPMDPAWSLRSRIEQNPMAWMIQVNGFLVDARFLKREIQEEALRKGLIPYVDDDGLRTYYKHLAAKLKFPVEATWAKEVGLGEVTEKVSILSLGGFEDDPWIDDTYGILCQARMKGGEGEPSLAEMEKVMGKPNKQLVEDYAYWFWNNR